MGYLFTFLVSVVAFMLGGLIYSPAVLGKQWQKEMGFKEGDISKEEGLKAMGLGYLVILAEAFVLFFVKMNYEENFLPIALIVGVAVVLRQISNQVVYENRSKTLVMITLFHSLIEFVVLVLGIYFFA